MTTETNKNICFTLDLENDYGRIDQYIGFKNAEKLADIFKKYGLKLTIFTTGKIIKKKPEIIKFFQNNFDCEFQLHSYNHEVNKILSDEERLLDIKKAVSAYKNYFGKNPEGYRAPCGDLKDEDAAFLKNEGFLYSSSFMTTFRPGRFNNLCAGDKFFFRKNGLLEIPFSSLPFIKLPFSLGYFQLLGWPLVKILVRNKKTEHPIIFGFHLHNLSKLKNFKKLKPSLKLYYIRNQNKGFEILKKFIEEILALGYRSEKLTDIAKKTS